MRIRAEDYAIHNVMEDVADQAIDQVLSEDRSACACLRCRDDLKAQILNKVQHQYQAVLPGVSRTPLRLEELETGLFNKVMVECYKALIRVKENPRHEGESVALNNTTESLLRIAVSEVLSNQKLHLDRDALSRLMAEALNGLRPSYTTSHKGDAYTRATELDANYLAGVYSQIFRALEGLQTSDGQIT